MTIKILPDKILVGNFELQSNNQLNGISTKNAVFSAPDITFGTSYNQRNGIAKGYFNSVVTPSPGWFRVAINSYRFASGDERLVGSHLETDSAPERFQDNDPGATSFNSLENGFLHGRRVIPGAIQSRLFVFPFAMEGSISTIDPSVGPDVLQKAGISGPTHGYVAAGDPEAPASSGRIFKFPYVVIDGGESTDGSGIVGDLSGGKRKAVGFGSSENGYIGPATPPTTNPQGAFVDKFPYATDVNAVTGAPSPTATFANSDEFYGYLYSGPSGGLYPFATDVPITTYSRPAPYVGGDSSFTFSGFTSFSSTERAYAAGQVALPTPRPSNVFPMDDKRIEHFPFQNPYNFVSEIPQLGRVSDDSRVGFQT